MARFPIAAAALLLAASRIDAEGGEYNLRSVTGAEPGRIVSPQSAPGPP